ncbi:hypothetical protein C5S42_08580 [Candidatus Methanomarinus sp.]|nr:hypothetical protein C5S42_08580 [ANME-2 cluster archaeon]
MARETRNYSLHLQLLECMNIMIPMDIPHEHTKKHEKPDNYKRMHDQIPAAHRLSEQDPTNRFVDQVWQQGSERDKPVIKMTSDGWNCEACKKEDTNRNPKMSEDEHYFSYSIYIFINVHTHDKYRCGDV